MHMREAGQDTRPRLLSRHTVAVTHRRVEESRDV